MECRACGHKHGVWDADELKRTYEDTESFLQIEGTFELVESGLDWRRRKTTLHACPKCGTVRIDDSI